MWRLAGAVRRSPSDALHLAQSRRRREAELRGTPGVGRSQPEHLSSPGRAVTLPARRASRQAQRAAARGRAPRRWRRCCSSPVPERGRPPPSPTAWRSSSSAAPLPTASCSSPSPAARPPSCSGASTPCSATEPSADTASARVWGGTFHSVATRLLRQHGERMGLHPGFTIHDRGDSEDLLEVLRTELELGPGQAALPAQGHLPRHLQPLRQRPHPARAAGGGALPLVPGAGPRPEAALPGLRRPQGGAAGARLRRPAALLPRSARAPRRRGAGPRTVRRGAGRRVPGHQRAAGRGPGPLRPGGQGLTVVGDDAQAIYAFRAATVRNILDFPDRYPGAQRAPPDRELPQHPRAARGHQPGHRPGPRALPQGPLVEAAIRCAPGAADLRRRGPADRAGRWPASWSAGRREFGSATRRCCSGPPTTASTSRWSLVAAASPSTSTAASASWRPPTSATRWPSSGWGRTPGSHGRHPGPRPAPRHRSALHPGPAGPGGGQRALRCPGVRRPPPAAAGPGGRPLLALCEELAAPAPPPLATQLQRIRAFYGPLCEERYDHAEARLRDLESLERLAGGFRDRTTFLGDLTLEPPQSTQELAGPPVARRGLPRPQHHPLRQGPGVRRGLPAPRRGREHPLRPLHRDAGGDRRGAAAPLRRALPGPHAPHGQLSPPLVRPTGGSRCPAFVRPAQPVPHRPR